MHNVEIRELIKKNRIFNYEIAEKLHISEYTLCRWLRNELSTEKKQEITAAIIELTGGDISENISDKKKKKKNGAFDRI